MTVDVLPAPEIRARRRGFRRAVGLAWGRVCLTGAVFDGMFTGGLIHVPVAGFHVMGYRLLLPICAMIVMVHSAATFRLPGGANLHVRGFLGFLCAWVCLAILSLGWAVNTGDALRQLYFILEGVTFIGLLVLWITSNLWLERIVRVWLVAFGINVLVGVWEASTGNHLPGSGMLGLDDDYVDLLGRMPTSVFGNPNNLAFFLALTIPVALAWWRHRRAGKGAVALAGVIAAALFVVISTRSRTGIVGVTAGIGLWLWLPRVARARGTRTGRRRWRTLALSGAAVVVLSSTGIGALAWDRMASLYASLTSEREYDARTQLLLEVIDVLQRTNGLGVGAGNIETYLATYPFSQNSGVTNPHNWLMEIAGNYGIPLAVGYVLFYALLVRALWRAYKRQARHCSDRMLLEGALVGLLTFPFVTLSASSLAGVVFHWFFLGYCLAVLNNYRIPHRARPGPGSEP